MPFQTAYSSDSGSSARNWFCFYFCLNGLQLLVLFLFFLFFFISALKIKYGEISFFEPRNGVNVNVSRPRVT